MFSSIHLCTYDLCAPGIFWVRSHILMDETLSGAYNDLFLLYYPTDLTTMSVEVEGYNG